MFCARCRTENLDDAAWCTSCGADLEVQRTPSAATPRPTPAPGGTIGGRATELPLPVTGAFEEGAAIGPDGRYQVREELGRGGMGLVYRATDGLTGEDVALKVMLPSLLDSESAKKRFIAEAALARKLQHRNIVNVYGPDAHGELQLLVMECLDGRTLREELKALKAAGELMPVERAAEVARQCCAALEHAHGAGVLHRDVKPENVLLQDSADGGVRVKLLDFGIAGAVDPGQWSTMSRVLGTAGYASPEVLNGDGATVSSDLYALGVVLFECLTNRLPHGAEPPSRRRSGLAEGWDTVVVRLLAGEPELRPSAAAEVRALLGSVAGPGTESNRGVGREGAAEVSRAAGIPRDSSSSSQAPAGPKPVSASQPAKRSEPSPDSTARPATSGGRRPSMAPGTSLSQASAQVSAKEAGWWIVAVVAAIVAGAWLWYQDDLERDRLSAEQARRERAAAAAPDSQVEAEQHGRQAEFRLEVAGRNAEGYEVYRREADGARMILVPGGSFQMGSTDGDDDEKPVHGVELSSFLLDEREVTWEQYVSKRPPPEKPSWHPGGKHPVVKVSWEDARAYCQSVGMKLPTEAQWEYAARGSRSLKYPWGESWDERKANWGERGRKDGHEYTAPVGSFPSGAGPFGHLDLSGNVWEWVNDWYSKDAYASRAGGVRDPTGPPSGTRRVLRGGSFNYNYVSLNLRGANRAYYYPSFRHFNHGFRCAQDVP